MLILYHLFTGLIAGIVLFRLSGQRWAFWACALGSVLPDLIDKPLGHILFQATLDNGRLISHTLLFIGLIALAGFLLWKKQGKLLLLALTLGVLLHQLGDTMYLEPTIWFWPMLGPFPSEHYANYFFESIVDELTSAYEWFFGFVDLLLLAYFLQPNNRAVTYWALGKEGGVPRISIVLFAFSVIAVIVGFGEWSAGEEFGQVGAWYIASISAALGGMALELTSEKNGKMERI